MPQNIRPGTDSRPTYNQEAIWHAVKACASLKDPISQIHHYNLNNNRHYNNYILNNKIDNTFILNKKRNSKFLSDKSPIPT